jgi:hypothetical protein
MWYKAIFMQKAACQFFDVLTFAQHTTTNNYQCLSIVAIHR